MYLVFQSIPYQQSTKIPTLVRSSTVRSVAATKSWGDHGHVMLSIMTAHGSHFAIEYREAPTIEDAGRMLVHVQQFGRFPDAPPSDVETRVREILRSGKRPTKTQLRKALNGY